MLTRVEDIIRGKRIIGYGAGEYLDRAIKHLTFDFAYFVDEAKKGGEKFGKPICGVDRLKNDKKDTVIFIFDRYIPSAIATLTGFGFEWLKNVFDCRFFGVTSLYFDDYEIIRDIQDLRESGSFTCFLGQEAQLSVHNLTVPKNDRSARPIRIYVGNKANLRLHNIILEEGVCLFVGSGGNLNIEEGTIIREGTKISAAVSADVRIQEKVLISQNSIIDAANNTTIDLGPLSTFGWNLHLYAYAPITIGKDCMFSSNIYVESGAGHDLIVDGKKRGPEPVIVGDHVWMGMGSCVLSGGSIGANSMVGAYGLVKQAFGENLLIVGNPARVAKTGIQWGRDYTAYKEKYRDLHPSPLSPVLTS
ncbi:MAG: acyltransferase [Elusimicrobia bacterium]|nr:acyltransferase [Candidatus Obscuribacterium magneticum]